MGLNTNRNFARSYYMTHVMVSAEDNDCFNPVEMHNCCVDGIYFESEEELLPGYNVCIKMVNHSPDIDMSPEAYKVYRAKVKWCREIESSSRYGVGVQFSQPLNQLPC